MPSENLSPEHRVLVNRLIHNYDKIKFLIFAAPDGSVHQLEEPRIGYFNPGARMFRVNMANRQTFDILLEDIREVHICG